MADESETISVIIPVYNEDDGICDTLSRLWAAGAWLELLIVDASSEKACRTRLQQTIESQKTSIPIELLTNVGTGRAVQMNAGADRARGTTLLFLHADTALPANASARIAQALRNDRLWGRFDVRFDDDNGWLWWVARLMNLRSHASAICTGDQAMFVRADTFAAIGGFPAIPLMEDIEISRRLKKLGRPARIVVPVTTAGRRWQENGPIRTIVLMWCLRFGYWIGLPASLLARWYRHSRRAS